MFSDFFGKRKLCNILNYFVVPSPWISLRFYAQSLPHGLLAPTWPTNRWQSPPHLSYRTFYGPQKEMENGPYNGDTIGISWENYDSLLFFPFRSIKTRGYREKTSKVRVELTTKTKTIHRQTFGLKFRESLGGVSFLEVYEAAHLTQGQPSDLKTGPPFFRSLQKMQKNTSKKWD